MLQSHHRTGVGATRKEYLPDRHCVLMKMKHQYPLRLCLIVVLTCCLKTMQMSIIHGRHPTLTGLLVGHPVPQTVGTIAFHVQHHRKAAMRKLISRQVRFVLLSLVHLLSLLCLYLSLVPRVSALCLRNHVTRHVLTSWKSESYIKEKLALTNPVYGNPS